MATINAISNKSGTLTVDSVLTVSAGGAAITGASTINGGTVNLPNTNAAGTEGIIQFGAINWLHNYGLNNVFLGPNSGNQTLLVGGSEYNIGIGSGALSSLTIAGINNVAVGTHSSGQMTTATGNVMVGGDSGEIITTGIRNTGIGIGAFTTLLTGSNNTGLGESAGLNYIGAESDNVLISHRGVVGESNVMRIGTAGTQTSCYVSGIRDVATVMPDAMPVVIDSLGQLGTASIPTFLAYQVGDVANVTGDATSYHIIYDHVLYDLNGDYNAGTGVFTAPVAGIYQFVAGMYAIGITAAYEYYILSFTATSRTGNLVYLNGATAIVAGSWAAAGNSFMVDMNVGDTIFMRFQAGVGLKTVGLHGDGGVGALNTYFGGHLLVGI
jgi:hypothetical protein